MNNIDVAILHLQILVIFPEDCDDIKTNFMPFFNAFYVDTSED